MEWLKRMENALERIESRLDAPLSIEEIAAAAHSSPFHFQRMFTFVTGMTVAEYIRNRRLTLAAMELAASGARVVDVALKYGYDTPESFAKAFRRLHGIPPSEARRPGTPLKAFPPAFLSTFAERGQTDGLPTRGKRPLHRRRQADSHVHGGRTEQNGKLPSFGTTA